MSAAEPNWRDLLDLALPALDHVYGRSWDGTSRPGWTLGGGTALAIRIDHRISYDIDLFVPGVTLKLFTPAQNPAAKLISPVFRWPGHDLKFERPEGEIDFLSPPLQTEPGFTALPYRDRQIAVETLGEVIVKTIRFRSARFTARDVYDLAAVAEASPDLPNVLAAEVPDALARTLESTELQAARGEDALSAAIAVTVRGRALLPRAFAVARRALESAMALAS